MLELLKIIFGTFAGMALGIMFSFLIELKMKKNIKKEYIKLLEESILPNFQNKDEEFRIEWFWRLRHLTSVKEFEYLDIDIKIDIYKLISDLEKGNYTKTGWITNAYLNPQIKNIIIKLKKGEENE